MKHLLPFLLTGFLWLSIGTSETSAQCPMCKIAAESNMKNGGTSGNGLNYGILYMLAVPYLTVGTLAFVWVRNRRKLRAAQMEEENGDVKEI